MNGYQGQIRAREQQNQKFFADQQLFDIISNNTVGDNQNCYIKRLGIYAKSGTIVRINNEEIEIGKTNIYEIDQVEITSIQFKEDTSSQVILDFIIEFL